MKDLTPTPNNSVVTVLDEHDRTVFAKRLPNELTQRPTRGERHTGAAGSMIE
jgi:hypothetical protein